jgi:hypothetical protein
MAQHDYNIANQGASAFRSDVNNSLAAIISNNSGSTAPSTGQVAFYPWADSTNLLLYYRNSGNSAWLPKINLDSDMIASKSSAYTTVIGDYQKVLNCDASGSTFTVTVLASTSAGEGYEFIVKKTDSSTNTVTIDGNASETIDGATTLVLYSQYESARLRCDGANFSVIGRTPGVATQAQQEAGSNTAVFVTPGRQQYHPSAAKAWVMFSGTSSSVGIYASYNVTSITDNGTGDYWVNFTSAFSSTNYGFSLGAGRTTAENNTIDAVKEYSRSINSTAFPLASINTATAANLDAAFVSASFFGDQ